MTPEGFARVELAAPASYHQELAYADLVLRPLLKRAAELSHADAMKLNRELRDYIECFRPTTG
jgi:hypothetical protein